MFSCHPKNGGSSCLGYCSSACQYDRQSVFLLEDLHQSRAVKL
jgi:hypothetical protein